MDPSSGLIWKRSAMTSESDDIWDDRALIDAYDKAVKEVNKKIADKCVETNDKIINCEVSTSVDKPNDHSWHLGQYCRSSYSEDGIEYEAQIISINASNNTCFVKYIGYGNEEQKSLKELKPSLGKRHRKLQTLQFETQELLNSGSDNDFENSSTVKKTFSETQYNPIQSHNTSDFNSKLFGPSSSHSETPLPPPLPSILESSLPSDDESLASMLMSWYMSGYHTGYYRCCNSFVNI